MNKVRVAILSEEKLPVGSAIPRIADGDVEPYHSGLTASNNVVFKTIKLL